MTRLAWFVAFFLFASFGAAFADSTPPDPIIDMEPGGDAVEFTGVFTFTITQASLNNCTDIGQFCFVELPTLENFLPNNQNITSVELSFDVNQGTFQVAQNAEDNGKTDFPNAIFTTESTVIPGFSELFTGSTIQPCVVGEVPEEEEGNICEDQQTQSFHIGIAQAVLGSNGSTTVTVTANTANVPEPSSAVLILGGVGLLWTQRRRLLTRVPKCKNID